jgi:hypothetical protein
MTPAIRTEIQRALLELQFLPGVLDVTMLDGRGRPLLTVGAKGSGPVRLGDSSDPTVGSADRLARLVVDGELSQVCENDPNEPSVHCVLLQDRHVLVVRFESSLVTLEAVRARSRATAEEVSGLLS